MVKSKLLALALAAGAICFAHGPARSNTISLNINGSCETVNCPPSSALTFGSSATLPFSENITLADGDVFNVAGTLTAVIATDGAVRTNQVFTVEFLNGPDGVSQPGDTFDVLASSIFQTATTSRPITETESGTFSSGIATGSAVSISLAVDRNLLLTLGPFTAAFSDSKTATMNDVAPSFLLQEEFQLTFGAGSAQGSCIGLNTGAPCPVVTPLPAALPLFGGGLGMIGLLGWRRKRKALAA